MAFAAAAVSRVGISLTANTAAAEAGIASVRGGLLGVGKQAAATSTTLLAAGAITDRVSSSFGGLAYSTSQTANVMNRISGVADGLKDRFFDLNESLFGSRVAILNSEGDWQGLIGYLTGPALAGIRGWQSEIEEHTKNVLEALGFTISEAEGETSAGLENLNFTVGTSLTEFRRLMGEYGVAVPSTELPDILKTLGLDANSELIAMIAAGEVPVGTWATLMMALTASSDAERARLIASLGLTGTGVKAELDAINTILEKELGVWAGSLAGYNTATVDEKQKVVEQLVEMGVEAGGALAGVNAEAASAAEVWGLNLVDIHDKSVKETDKVTALLVQWGIDSGGALLGPNKELVDFAGMWGLNLVDIHDNTDTQLSGINQLWSSFESNFGSFASGIAASVSRINSLVVTGPQRRQAHPTGVDPNRPRYTGTPARGTVTGNGQRLAGTVNNGGVPAILEGDTQEYIDSLEQGNGGPPPPAINPAPPNYQQGTPQILPGDPPELISIVNNFNGPVISPSRVMEATEKVIQEHNRTPSRYYDDYDDSGIPIEGY